MGVNVLVQFAHYHKNRSAASYNGIHVLKGRTFLVTPLFLELITFTLGKEGAGYPKVIVKRNPSLKKTAIFLLYLEDGFIFFFCNFYPAPLHINFHL